MPDQSRRTYRQLRWSAPAGATELFLVRHGESAEADPEQPFELLDGRGDPPLSPLGIEQAAQLATRLAPMGFSAIYVTNLRRTAETAAPLAEALGLTPIVESGLTEVFMGDWEGGRYRERIENRDPLVQKLFTEQRWDVVPGGETNDSLFARTTEAVRRIAAAHPNQRVVVFSHAVAISAVLSRATRATPFAYITHDNAAISELVVDGEIWSLRRFNDRAHLD